MELKFKNAMINAVNKLDTHFQKFPANFHFLLRNTKIYYSNLQSVYENIR